MTNCRKGFRLLLALLNVILLVLGGFLLYCVLMFMNTNGGSITVVNLKPVVVMLATAAITILGALLGICGAFTEKKGCLGVYMVFIWAGLIILTVMTALLLTAQKPLRDSIDDFLLDEMHLYGLSGNDSVVVNNKTLTPNEGFNTTLFIDTVQQDGKCCGYNNYTDWATFPYSTKNFTDVPKSCCKNPCNCTGSLNDLDEIYQDGCHESFNSYFSYYYGFLTWTSLGLAIVAFSAIVIGIGLLCARRSNPFDYTGFGEPGYTTV